MYGCGFSPDLWHGYYRAQTTSKLPGYESYAVPGLYEIKLQNVVVGTDHLVVEKFIIAR
jgi:hypothetical protein